MKKTLILLGFLALAPFAKGQLLLEALEGEIPFTPSEKCLERVKDKHYGDGVHNYIYCAVQGPNGKKWLNLNLGAEYAKESSPHFNPEALPTDYNDWKAFGNLYQWGRDSDGHEQVEYRQGSERWEFRPINGVRNTRLAVGEQSNQMVNDPKFGNYADGLGDTWINDPCPNGYHIATFQDIIDIGKIDINQGELLTTSVFGSSNYPNLKVVTSPALDNWKGETVTEGWNRSLAQIRGGGTVGTSLLWIGGEPLEDRGYLNGEWKIYNMFGNTPIKARIGVMDYYAGNALYYLTSYYGAGAGSNQYAIRCVQN